jgi:hypothetical protein
MMRPAILLLALGVVLAGDATTSGFAQRASAAEPARAAWSEVKWPFPLDQWGLGRAFRCPAAERHRHCLYVRAGFCTATGVSTTRSSTGWRSRIAEDVWGLRDGRPLVGWMNAQLAL